MEFLGRLVQNAADKQLKADRKVMDFSTALKTITNKKKLAKKYKQFVVC